MSICHFYHFFIFIFWSCCMIFLTLNHVLTWFVLFLKNVFEELGQFLIKALNQMHNLLYSDFLFASAPKLKPVSVRDTPCREAAHLVLSVLPFDFCPPPKIPLQTRQKKKNKACLHELTSWHCIVFIVLSSVGVMGKCILNSEGRMSHHAVASQWNIQHYSGSYLNKFPTWNSKNEAISGNFLV